MDRKNKNIDFDALYFVYGTFFSWVEYYKNIGKQGCNFSMVSHFRITFSDRVNRYLRLCVCVCG